MKDKIQGFVIGAVSASLLISGGVYAYSRKQNNISRNMTI